MPVGFYVVVQFDGTKRRTKNKQARLHGGAVEWDDKIQMYDTLYSVWFLALIISRPSGPSAKVHLSVYASFEFSPMLGNGEVLRTVDICVGNLVDDTHRKHRVSHTGVVSADGQHSNHILSK